MGRLEIGSEIDALRSRIVGLESELAEARATLRQLESDRAGRGSIGGFSSIRSSESASVTAASSSAEKLALFRARFAGRDDVYAVRWTSSRTGKSG